MYVVVPPTTLASAEPVLSPLHVTLTTLIINKVGAPASFTVAADVSVHRAASLTVTV